MQPERLERYLHEHIPLSAAMQVRVLHAEEFSVVLGAPLAPNINHRDSVFGGSASALAILAAWSLMHVRLTALGKQVRVVIQRNTIEYDAPILGEFTARSFLPDAEDWARFVRTLERRGRGRVRVAATVRGDGVEAASFEGDFVAIDTGRERPRAQGSRSPAIPPPAE